MLIAERCPLRDKPKLRPRMMNRNDGDDTLVSAAAFLPLILASPCVSGNDGTFPLDRIRMQKAVFLVTREASGMRRDRKEASLLRQWSDAYVYEPYNWGPYSSRLNDDLGTLQRRGLMILSFAGDARYGRYVLTQSGVGLVERVWHSIGRDTCDLLASVRTWVTSRDFNSLLREVYEEFPEYATKSRWNERR
ncbi:hypothetical protein [Nocardioides sp. L-11A]|uniref:hypothetical protein n=1 Tax=Nocardioides sp. L-11A TaxID=3043848 RepID=UPI00249CB823|nr:hypothetical protein QJ852_01680 [Nocardioides sp. L-11A]